MQQLAPWLASTGTKQPLAAHPTGDEMLAPAKLSHQPISRFSSEFTKEPSVAVSKVCRIPR
jgi:hypothetical protein